MDAVVKKIDEIELLEVTTYGSKGVKMQWIFTIDDGVENFAMRRFIMERGGEIPEHSHWYEHEIFMLKGKCLITVNGKEIIAEKGMALFVPPNAKHSYKNIGDEEVEFLCMIPLKKPSS